MNSMIPRPVNVAIMATRTAFVLPFSVNVTTKGIVTLNFQLSNKLMMLKGNYCDNSNFQPFW